MSYDLDYHDDIELELATLDDENFAAWDALLEALMQVEALRAMLETDRDVHYADPQFDHQPVGVLRAAGYNIYRLKLMRPTGQPWPYRLLFALHHPKGKIYLLGLMPRSENYDRHAPVVSRVLQRYNSLGIPPALV